LLTIYSISIRIISNFIQFKFDIILITINIFNNLLIYKESKFIFY